MSVAAIVVAANQVDIDAGKLAAANSADVAVQKFAAIVPGQTRQDQVLRTVGAPSEIRFYRNVGMNGWNYPFKESNTWDSMMTIYVDNAGLVQRMENGPDPRLRISASFPMLRPGHRCGHWV